MSEVVEPQADDSAAFRPTGRIPDRPLAEAAAHDFAPAEAFRLMDRAIERFAARDRHPRLAKAVLLHRFGRDDEAKALLETMAAERDRAAAEGDEHFRPYVFFARQLIHPESVRPKPPEG
jgi:hypothetical protein